MEEVTKQERKQVAQLAADLKTISHVAEFNGILNNDPPANWIKQHPTIKVDGPNGQKMALPYLPIGIVEELLRAIFPAYRIEVISTSLLANAVTCHVRVHYQHPVTMQWEYHDGVGASDLQTKKGHGATDFSALNSGAVPKALPAAKSYAIKDACEHFGKLFGRDINRVHTTTIDQRYIEVVDNADDQLTRVQQLKQKQ